MILTENLENFMVFQKMLGGGFFHLRIQKSMNPIDFHQRNYGFHGCRENLDFYILSKDNER